LIGKIGFGLAILEKDLLVKRTLAIKIHNLDETRIFERMIIG